MKYLGKWHNFEKGSLQLIMTLFQHISSIQYEWLLTFHTLSHCQWEQNCSSYSYYEIHINTHTDTDAHTHTHIYIYIYIYTYYIIIPVFGYRLVTESHHGANFLLTAWWHHGFAVSPVTIMLASWQLYYYDHVKKFSRMKISMIEHATLTAIGGKIFKSSHRTSRSTTCIRFWYELQTWQYHRIQGSNSSSDCRVTCPIVCIVLWLLSTIGVWLNDDSVSTNRR